MIYRYWLNILSDDLFTTHVTYGEDISMYREYGYIEITLEEFEFLSNNEDLFE